MATILLVTIIIFCTTATIAKDADVCHGGTRKFNPGFTVVEENGQFLKVLGMYKLCYVNVRGKSYLPLTIEEFACSLFVGIIDKLSIIFCLTLLIYVVLEESQKSVNFQLNLFIRIEGNLTLLLCSTILILFAEIYAS